MYAPASVERHYQIEVAVLWIRGIMMFACVTSFWADTRRFLQHAYSSLFGSIHHYHHHVVACACFYTFTIRAFLVLMFLAACCWTWNRWRPFCKLGSPYTILLYCLGICAMWLALMLPPRLNLLHDNFAATFAFIICNYVFLPNAKLGPLFWMNNTEQVIPNIVRGGYESCCIFPFICLLLFAAIGLFLWWMVYTVDVLYSWRYNRWYSSRTIKHEYSLK